MKNSSDTVDPKVIGLLLIKGIVIVSFCIFLSYKCQNYEVMTHQALAEEIQAAEQRGRDQAQKEKAQPMAEIGEEISPGPPSLMAQ